jgi:hypothetical protein
MSLSAGFGVAFAVSSPRAAMTQAEKSVMTIKAARSFAYEIRVFMTCVLAIRRIGYDLSF